MADSSKRVRTPLLRAYLNELPTYPSYSPTVPSWLPYAVFFVALAILFPIPFPIKGMSFLFAGLIGMAVHYYLRHGVQPKNDTDRLEKRFMDAVEPLQKQAHDSPYMRMPEPVLVALERAAATRSTLLAKLHAETDYMSLDEKNSIEAGMRAALMAAVPTFRKEDMPKRDWEAIDQNHDYVAQIVVAIETAESRMMNGLLGSTERLAALRELNDFTSQSEQQLSE